MIVHEMVEVDNPAEVLRNEDGIFEVTSPYGHIFEVVCRRGAKMNVREISEPRRTVSHAGVTWRIRRIRQAVA